MSRLTYNFSNHRHQYIFALILVISSLLLPSARAGSALCAIFQSAPAWSSLSQDQKSCTTGNLSPAWNTYSCNDKSCFCNDPQKISQKAMDCVLYMGVMDDPLPAYNGAMNFYANECGFQVILKVYFRPIQSLSRRHIFLFTGGKEREQRIRY